MGTCHVCVDMGGHGCNLKGKCRALVLGKFLSIVGQHPSDFKSNKLHVDIFRFRLIHFDIYSIDSSN